jgi:hypothetical protein
MSKYKTKIIVSDVDDIRRCYRKSILVEYDNKNWFVDNIEFIRELNSYSAILIVLDEGVEKILKRKAEKLSRLFAGTLQLMRDPNYIFCEGCGRRKPKQGSVYGKKDSLHPLQQFCHKCATRYSIVPYQDLYFPDKRINKPRPSSKQRG